MRVARERIATQCVCCGGRALARSPAVLMPFVAHRVFGWAPVEITRAWGLATIQRGMAYTICSSLQCLACGHLFLDIRFSHAEMRTLYEGYRGPAYVALREGYEPGYAARNTALQTELDYLSDVEEFLSANLPSRPAVLDWGGNTGANTPFKRTRRVHDVYDIGGQPTIAGARRVSKAVARRQRYDLIVCSHVLEHTPYPGDVIREMTAMMGTKTVLYIEVPLEDLVRTAPSVDGLSPEKKHWHEHINFYNRASLSALIEGCGLAILEIEELSTAHQGRSLHVYQVACARRRRGNA